MKFLMCTLFDDEQGKSDQVLLLSLNSKVIVTNIVLKVTTSLYSVIQQYQLH